MWAGFDPVLVWWIKSPFCLPQQLLKTYVSVFQNLGKKTLKKPKKLPTARHSSLKCRWTTTERPCNPKIMLFVAATSVLKLHSKKKSQMHWIIRAPGISHRLSTNTNADKIILMNKGQVAKQGAHS
jgi:hypothetical protein